MTVDDIRADLEKIAERLDRTQQSIANELMPATPSHLDPGERYARAFDLARLGVVDARHRAQRLLDGLGFETAAAGDEPLQAVLAEIEAEGHEYIDFYRGRNHWQLTTDPAAVTCPDCREWVARNMPPDVSVLDPATPDDDVPEPQEGER